MAKAKSLDTPKDSGDTAEPTQKKSGSRLAVATAYLHQAVMVKSVISSEKHLGVGNMRHEGKIILEWGPEGLWVIPVEPGLPTSIVPQANVANVVLK